MSFDLMVLVNTTAPDTQVKWLEKLKASGIDCQLPNDFILAEALKEGNEANEVSIQYRFIPPLVKQPTDPQTFECYLEPWQLDDESRNEMIESTADQTLKQKIAGMTAEIQLSSSAGRDDHGLILQCFVAATLADACDGVLVDPQEYGAVNNEKIYQIAYHHCQHAIDGLAKNQSKDKINTQQPNKTQTNNFTKSPSFVKKLFGFFNLDSNNHEPFSPYAISVKADWMKVRTTTTGKYTLNDHVNQMGSDKCRNLIVEYINEDYRHSGAPTAFKWGLMLQLLNKHLIVASYYFDATIELNKKIYSCIEKNNFAFNDKPQSLAVFAGKCLESYLAAACSITITKPGLPNKEKLLEGIKLYHEAVLAMTSRKGFWEPEQHNIVFIVMALLADENELALIHLKLCNKDKETKKHRNILSKINSELIKSSPNKLISNPELEGQFFELFNGYRLPNINMTMEFIGEYEILNTPFGSYVFAWLYLKLFKGQTESTWPEMRLIMMS